jgi:hypothetical protein
MTAPATYPDRALADPAPAVPNLAARRLQARIMAVVLFLATLLALFALAVLI